jgi:hypothetical protein
VIRLVDGRIVEDVRTGRSVAGGSRSSRRRAAARSARRARNDLRVAAGAVRIALQALRRNVMRTMLTMLGVIIGVAAVITMMEMSQGASEAIQVTVTNMGANTLVVSPGAPTGATAGRPDGYAHARGRRSDPTRVSERGLRGVDRRDARTNRLREPQLVADLFDRQHDRVLEDPQLDSVGSRAAVHRTRSAQRRPRLPARPDRRTAVVRRPQSDR